MVKVLGKIHQWKYPLLVIIICVTVWNVMILKKKSAKVMAKYHVDGQKLRSFFSIYHKRDITLEKIKTRSGNYDEILDEISFYDLLRQNTMQERCMIYFNHLSASKPEWMMDPHEGIGFDRDAYKSFENYREEALRKAEEAEKKAEEEGREYEKPSAEQIQKNYEEIREKTLRDEQTLHDYAAHVRIFKKCFLANHKDGDETFIKRQRSFLNNDMVYIKSSIDEVSGKVHKNELSCHEVEEKVFPWLTRQFPEFTRWNGAKSLFPGDSARKSSPKGCFLSEYKSRLNGRGIVMTLKDDHLSDATRFIRVLRYLGNKYPIQVVYHENLSKESKNNLVRAAQDSFRGYPGQDLWFVNAAPAVAKNFRSKFGGFSNKIAATMFNSFQEIMFCDADAVLLKDPSYFFSLKKFLQTGTMFFKDRASGEFRGKDDVVFFQKLLPSVEDSVVFNVPQPTKFTLQNEFFNHFSHYMESGVVLIDRKRHFIQPLMMSLLSFYYPVIGRLYGDKELFWLSLAIAGDESYAFNDNFAAAIGEFTPDLERQKDFDSIQSFRSREICSNHPSHISDIDNHTLLWFNSGFRHCGNTFKAVKWDEEFSKKTRYTSLKTINEFKTFFAAPIKIANAIIPPFLVEDRLLENLEHEPQRQWRMANYCNNYLWCAYSSIGGVYEEDGVTKDNMIQGTIVTFTPEEIQMFEAAADVWTADFDWNTEGDILAL